ncbi:MAG: 1-deoxy-D-xylulose-5-phosphate reductoisomerase [Gammaproteobacteria bacterium]|nr:1-deoxy-D-xylulose-5-phosphate reductoisomerase [Gammaproteobacteria bacterium]|tara:strand:- start:48844 stop:50046 length:1203 start_codon:yes stop_codon:yes gene_type:complete
MRYITILGSTSTIGVNTLQVLSGMRNKYKIFALTAYSNYKLLFKQIIKHNPTYAVLIDKNSGYKLIKLCKDHNIKTKIILELDSLNFVVKHRKSNCVMSAIVGSAALEPTLNAIKSSKIVFLANKESLIMSGKLLIDNANKYNSNIIPIDSEHNAILQILLSSGLDYKPGSSLYYRKNIKEIILTASGGPFLNISKNKLSKVTPKQAIKHPNWKMGKKISIDSATMMNKGLEIIEANILFGLNIENIKVIIHPQSIIHALVRYPDGSVISHMSNHDMKIPISYALSWPARMNFPNQNLNFRKYPNLTFEYPKKNQYPCLDLAYQSIKIGKNAPTILNAANEVSVQYFLKNKIKFTHIPVIIEEVLSSMKIKQNVTLKSILENDKNVREYTVDLINTKKWK